MARRSKRYIQELITIAKEIDANITTSVENRTAKSLKSVINAREFTLEEAINLIKKAKLVKFDPSLNVAVNLNIDPKKGDQNIRGSAVLPGGLGKEIKVAVFARDQKAEEAKRAGADYVGAEDLVAAIQEGNLDFQTVISTPDCMTLVAKVGKILGPRGLMPSPKTGTVTLDVETAVKQAKAGKVEFKNDKGGTVHAAVGKLSFPVDSLRENVQAIVSAISRVKPQTVKGQLIKSVYLSHSQGPGLRVKLSDLSI